MNQQELKQKTVALAERWQRRSNELQERKERNFYAKIHKMVVDPLNKVFLTELIDQSFRPKDRERAAEQIAYLLEKYRGNSLFGPLDQGLVTLYRKGGRHFPKIAVPAIINRIRSDTASVILDGERDKLIEHLRKRRSEGSRVNLNIIGEAILGEEEASHRLEIYEQTLRLPEVNYISIKISTIYSQINALAFDETVAELAERLARIYRAAIANPYTGDSGAPQPKFVNLDMEEYRDMALTIAAFKATLDRDEFRSYHAGIVLQAYLPDAYDAQQDLTRWAKRRVDAGGAPVKVRLVKGANMDMERTEASLRDWPMVTFDEKVDTDANYKRMLRYALVPDNARAVHLGIASHNLFELAHAKILIDEANLGPYVVYEVLEGMADGVRRALQDERLPVLHYAPVATRENFTHAIAYYVRRLDENTSPENFLTYSFKLSPDSENWQFLKNQFENSLARIESLPTQPNRAQNRLLEQENPLGFRGSDDRFANEPDTDWTRFANREWARAIRRKWKRAAAVAPNEIPLVVAGKAVFEGQETLRIRDLAQYEKNLTLAHCALASNEQIDLAVATAKEDPAGWRNYSAEKRRAIFSEVAQQLRQIRGDLIGVAAAEVGKVLSETDPEVSEAIDFAEFYPFSLKQFENRKNLKLSPKGVGLVVTPWNFPIAIPAGGVVASLAAGNTTILKPAPQSAFCAYMVCQAFWRAGVPKETLQFLPCANDPQGTRLVSHPDISFVIFTGSTDTGLFMLQQNPRLRLYAETGGKNAMVVSSLSDRDQAIPHIVQSAFGNTGQKCSATSLLLLERPLYEDASFRRALVDAARSLPCGSPWKFHTSVGPLANPIGGKLQHALDNLDEGEEWALRPRRSSVNPNSLTPGIRWGTRRDSYCYKHELFGPVLSVMPYDTLEEAIELINGTDYGLTSGIQSLDEREVAIWLKGAKAGNLYVNRGTTGAIVLRQPFGGMGKSAIGPGIKAGGWNYALQFAKIEEPELPSSRSPDHPLVNAVSTLADKAPLATTDEDRTRITAALESSVYEYINYFQKQEDYFEIRGEENYLRYVPMRQIAVRVEAEDSLFSILTRVFNTRLTEAELIVSASIHLPSTLSDWLREIADRLNGTFVEEDQASLASRFAAIERVRFSSPEAVEKSTYEVAAKTGYYLATDPPHIDGRIELLNYFREQSVSNRYHRYGNLGAKQLDKNPSKPKAD